MNGSRVPLRDSYVVDRQLGQRVVRRRDRRFADVCATVAIGRGRGERRSDDECQEEKEEAIHDRLRGQEEEGNQEEHPHAQEHELLSPGLERSHHPTPRQGARGSEGEAEECEWSEEQEREEQHSG
jgi:hypothetical protein